MLRGRVLQSAFVHERRARLVARSELALHEARVPVPHPPAVLALAHVLLEPGQVGGSGPVRVVRGDRVGDLVERPEAVLEVLAHEHADAHGAVLLDLRGDVDEHQPARDRFVVGADRHHRRDAAERRAHEHRWLRERLGDLVHVTGEGLGAVVAVVGPVALAVAAQVDAVDVPTRVRPARRGRTPGEAGLPTTVEQHHRRGIRVAELVGAQPEAVEPAEVDRVDVVGARHRSGSRRCGHRVAADVLVGDVTVGRPLAGHAEDPLGDQVALDLVAAPGEAGRLPFEEVLARAAADRLGAGGPGDARRRLRARAGWWSCARPTWR